MKQFIVMDILIIFKLILGSAIAIIQSYVFAVLRTLYSFNYARHMISRCVWTGE